MKKLLVLVLVLLPTAAAAKVDLDEVRGLLAIDKIDGWLLYDYEGQNPIAVEVVAPTGLQTRRWFYFIPAKGEPIALIHKIEAANFADVPGTKIEYASWRDLEAGLKILLKGKKKIAMEYSASSSLPSLSRVDAGTIELVEEFGVKVVSSADLVQATKSRWSAEGRESHYVAVHQLDALKDEALAFIAAEIREGETVTEYDVQQLIFAGYADRGLVSDYAPIVAAGANAANPHYEPTATSSAVIREGDLVLIDLWGRVDGDSTIYADMTWMAYVGAEVPKEHAETFAIVVKARDDTVAFIKKKLEAGKTVKGYEADGVARKVITKAGHEDHFLHRTGHSIDTHVHGDGANLDDFETHDTRALLMGAGFSVEPGIYVAGEYGMRSEIDCYIGDDGLEITTPVQREITAILK